MGYLPPEKDGNSVGGARVAIWIAGAAVGLWLIGSGVIGLVTGG